MGFLQVGAHARTRLKNGFTLSERILGLAFGGRSRRLLETPFKKGDWL
jgi:hypothetical protein